MALPTSQKDLDGKKRRLSSELDPKDYIEFELNAYKRGVTPYRLASCVLESFIRGDLVEKVSSSSQYTSVAGRE